jgi:hypothetical protein
VNGACRRPGCGEVTPRPLSAREAVEWIMSHGREAHRDPYAGARWTAAPRAREDGARETGTRARQGRTPR